MSSKYTYQTLLDLCSDHLPISVTIPTSPLINSIFWSSSFNYNISRWDEYLFLYQYPLPTSLSFTTPGNINWFAKTRWSFEIADAVAKRRRAFSRAHCSEEYRQNYFIISRYTSTMISKAKVESVKKTCSSLFFKTLPSEFFSLLRSISGSPSSFSSDLPNVTNCRTPIDCAN